MAEDKEPEVNNEPDDDSSDASFGVDDSEEPKTPEKGEGDKESPESSDEAEEPKPDVIDVEDEDFEALLLDEAFSEDTDADEDVDEEVDKPKPSALSNELSSAIARLKELGEQLEALPEAQDANFQRLRRMNRELVKTKVAELEGIPDLSVFGDADKVKEAVEAYDGLFGYDTARGVPSSEKFAEWLVQKDPRLAYDTTLRLLMGKTDDGRQLLDLVTTNVLGLDPTRLEDFQAISKGEIPEGYEGMITSDTDIANVPNEFRDAFKTLTPKLKQIVLDGFETYASKADQAEAIKLLGSANDTLKQSEQARVQEQQHAQELAEREVETYAEIGNEAVGTIASTMTKALDRVVFSENEILNTSMRNSIISNLFALKNDSAVLRKQAQDAFESWGINFSTEQQQQLDHWYGRLAEAVQTETSSKLRGYKDVYQRARQSRREAETRLAVFGLKIGAEVARKVGAKPVKGKTPPKDTPPHIEGGGGGGESKKKRSPSDYAKATQAGQVLR